MADEHLAGPSAKLCVAVDGIYPQPRGQHGRAIRLAVVAPAKQERRLVAPIQRPDHGLGCQFGDNRVVGGQESHAKIIFQKRVDAVERSAGTSAGNGNELIADNDPQGFGTHRGAVETHGGFAPSRGLGQ